jgi:tetratricopeptide (TPR) repeat protein
MANKKDSSEPIDIGHQHINSGDFHRASEAYTKAIDAKDGYGYLGRGLARYYVGKYEQAIDDFLEYARRLSDFYYEGWIPVGFAYLELGQYYDAISYFNNILTSNEAVSEWVVYYGRGLAYLFLKQNELAIADLEKAVKYPADLEKYEASSVEYLYDAVVVEKAIALARQEKDVSIPDIDMNITNGLKQWRMTARYRTLGRIFRQVGNFSGAIIAFQNILKLSVNPKELEQANEALKDLQK